MMYVRFPLSLRNVEDLLAERGIDICHETVRHCWNRFGQLFATIPAVRLTRPPVQPHWLSGRTSWPEPTAGKGELRQSETSCD